MFIARQEPGLFENTAVFRDAECHVIHRWGLEPQADIVDWCGVGPVNWLGNAPSKPSKALM